LHFEIVVMAEAWSSLASSSRVLPPLEDMSGWGQSDPDGPNSNQCWLDLSVITKDTNTRTHTHRYDGRALVDGPPGWSEKASHLRGMSFQPDEQSASSKDLYPNQYGCRRGSPRNRPSTVPTARRARPLNGGGFVSVCQMCEVLIQRLHTDNRRGRGISFLCWCLYSFVHSSLRVQVSGSLMYRGFSRCFLFSWRPFVVLQCIHRAEGLLVMPVKLSHLQHLLNLFNLNMYSSLLVFPFHYVWGLGAGRRTRPRVLRSLGGGRRPLLLCRLMFLTSWVSVRLKISFSRVTLQQHKKHVVRNQKNQNKTSWETVT